jgi:hypothetical protein
MQPRDLDQQSETETRKMIIAQSVDPQDIGDSGSESGRPREQFETLSLVPPHVTTLQIYNVIDSNAMPWLVGGWWQAIPLLACLSTLLSCSALLLAAALDRS